MDGSPAVRLSDGRPGGLSPDGQWAIAFSQAFPSPYLEIVPTGAGDRRRLPDNGLGYVWASWLPDGERAVVGAVEQGKAHRLYVLDLDWGRPTPVSPEGIGGVWTVSPDGSTVAAQGPGPAIVLYRVDGSGSEKLPGTTGGELPLEWINDGLLVLPPPGSGAPRGEVYKIDRLTGRQQPWRNILPSDPAGIMGLGSLQATLDGRTQAYTWHRALSNLYIADGLV